MSEFYEQNKLIMGMTVKDLYTAKISQTNPEYISIIKPDKRGVKYIYRLNYENFKEQINLVNEFVDFLAADYKGQYSPNHAELDGVNETNGYKKTKPMPLKKTVKRKQSKKSK